MTLTNSHHTPAVGILYLAAGNSSRMGQPKQLLPIRQQQSLIQKVVSEGFQTQAITIAVVTGPYHRELSLELASYPVRLYQNRHWARGMGSSISLGVRSMLADHPELDAVILAVTDQPHLASTHLNSLIDTHISSQRPIVISQYQEGKGTPALFYKSYFKALQRLDGPIGASALIRQEHQQVISVPFPLGHIDLDQWEDYQAYLRAFK
ncbi:molybdenum cofactor cytidylyltransferase [Dyadobacter jejuensis]|uniref:Molybdenum cofactor cytidylyltransferase n=1 Tax=Dyadobacter jejuensis TaxID=1082580 RepID=A0A316AHA7_9BACT|nr:nucleotidyltransferase family protein [Dyadobacter jejuensis]PWJ57125.1 molybdenum cofactor cytidylyltransferase [Dyadobacter jejuensis]